MNVRWSVVITTRNRADKLRRAIKSCLAQTVPCQIVVVDEGSEDDTPKVIEEFPGLKYIRNSVPIGHSAAANKGIQETDADWIKPLDDDDWLAPDCIEQMTKAVVNAEGKNLNPVLVSGCVINVDEETREKGRSNLLSEIPAALKSRDLLELMMIDQAPLGTPIQVGHSREASLRVGGGGTSEGSFSTSTAMKSNFGSNWPPKATLFFCRVLLDIVPCGLAVRRIPFRRRNDIVRIYS